ncbi:MAG: ABC transporter permease [Chloroflexota bacterium]
MPPIVRFLIYRVLAIPITLFIITAIIYAFILSTPLEVRASLYLSSGVNPDRMTSEQIQQITDRIIKDYHLNEPYPVQYAYWAASLLRGDWGWSPVLDDNVLKALLRRTPVTAELTLYSLLLFIPLGLASGVVAGWRKNRAQDHLFRLMAFTATSLPTFVLALVLLAIFYVSLHWFAPERLSITNDMFIKSGEFQTFTGLLTIDGFLNGRVDISLDAARHLVLPVITLCLLHWATLGRVTRAAMIEELGKDYAIAAKARGHSELTVVWKHCFRNALSPALTSSALSAATLITGVFIVEVIYNFKGISELVVVSAARDIPDTPTVMGFAVYSVIIVLLLMLVLDILQAVFDPRIREGVIGS